MLREDDLVTRLRERAGAPSMVMIKTLLTEAADHITELEAELADERQILKGANRMMQKELDILRRPYPPTCDKGERESRDG